LQNNVLTFLYAWRFTAQRDSWYAVSSNFSSPLSFLQTFLVRAMKLIFATLFIGAASTADLAFKIDPNNAVGELQTLMAGAQSKLAHAQHHHEKVVQKLRKTTEKDFKDDMVSLEGGITSYAADLSNAERELQVAVNSSKAELKREQAIPTPVGDWDSKSSMEKAQLNAIIGSSERVLRHDDRHNERDVREAEEQAGQLVEDEATKLSMKLGDLTSVSDDVKKGITDYVTDEMASAAVRDSSKPTPKEAPLKGDEDARLRAQEKILQASETQSAADQVAAKKKFGVFLAKATTDIQSKSNKVVSDLQVAEKKELDRIDGKAPPKKVIASKKTAQPQKAKRDAKQPKRLHEAVKKLSQNLAAKAKSAAKKSTAAPKAPVRKVAHHLPAMRDATPAERRASAHKMEMKKVRAARAQAEKSVVAARAQKKAAAPPKKVAAPVKVGLPAKK